MQKRRQRPSWSGHPVTEGTISDLIVVLREHHEALGRNVVRRRAEPPPAEARVAAVVDVGPVKRFGQLRDGAEIRVVAIALVGHQRAQRVVKVICPGAIACVALAAPPHHARVVESALGDEERLRACLVYASREGGHDVLGARVEDRVDRVQSQPVDAELTDPPGGALQHPFADRIAIGVVVVDRPAPGSLVLVGEVRAKCLERLHPRRPDVVVDDIEDHRETVFVSRRDERREARRSAIGGLRGGDVDPVVSPPVRSRKLRHGHDLDRRDAELRELAQVRRRGLERPLRRERADVQLIDHELLERGRIERLSGRGQLEHPRGAPQPLRLPARAWIGSRSPVEHKPVVVPGASRGDYLINPITGWREREVLVAEAQRDRFSAWRPHAELDAAVPSRVRAERAFPWIVHSGTRYTAPSGGSVTSADTGWPCHGTGSGSTPPRLPTSLPP